MNHVLKFGFSVFINYHKDFVLLRTRNMNRALTISNQYARITFIFYLYMLKILSLPIRFKDYKLDLGRIIILTSGNEDAGFKDYGSALNASAVDDWEKISERGRVAKMTHYGDPTESLLLELKGEIRELRNRISSLESKLDKLLESRST